MKKAAVQPIHEPFDVTEDAVALKFTQYHADLRWCQIWGRWLVWDGNIWKLDETVHVYDQVRTYCRNQSEWTAEEIPDKKRFCTASFVAAVEKLARSDRAYVATPDQFDANDWVINTPGGIVDLENAEVQKPEPNAYCTKIAAASVQGDCNRWREFLGEITNFNVELIDYLQRVVGYCLTGTTREHALFFLYGTGGNGKSVFLDTITGLLGDYARNAPMEVFTESHSDRHPTELAMLQGARLVVANETEQGKRWAQSRIKALTGGDTVTARFMRMDFFEFKPKFKLMIAGNSKPKLDTVDEAMRRRFHIVPFTVQIQNRDTDLSRKLKAEWPGILKWALEGCLSYQQIGLAPPASVIDATREYLDSQDIFAEWLDTCCETAYEHWETPALLFNSWRKFAESSKERVGTRATLKERMETAGFEQCRDKARGRYWQGIRVKPQTGDWRG